MLALVLLSLTTLVSYYTEEAPYEVTMEYEELEVMKYPATRLISTDFQDVMPHDGPENSTCLVKNKNNLPIFHDWTQFSTRQL